MTSVCVECRNTKYADEMVERTSLCCPCPVHESCWLERVQECVQARVAFVRCARCWAIVWVQKHKLDQEDTSDEQQPKRQRM
jgi:hypothetical protein